MTSLQEYLNEGENILWMRDPSENRWATILVIIQTLGHVLLTGVAVLFAAMFPVTGMMKIILGIILIISTNAPLVVWSIRRLPQLCNKGDATLFVTDQRVGKIRDSGELRQAPICPGLKMSHEMGLLRFRLGERTPVSFGGLNQEEALLITAVVEGLVKKEHDRHG